MSVEKAKKFLGELAKNKAMQEKFSGFTLEELKKAAESMKASGELSESDLDNVAGGTGLSLITSTQIIGIATAVSSGSL